ncbi:Modification methylase EcaI (modular protein) [Candidatus Nitrospira nitrosa]|uniref:Modification methylase EcaI (Modular protein) n=1 Tax=Candidatus Nitrospira nitrosa TaxID=1742972 RepID=A0A0S4LAF5_9BACT|nr:DNA methyltransferase [Candidatus Nitrospira nitrosa]CUS33616.1 Modification methylase EcaI (modular protein) [Candidatus Nitrospira nitrosa]
MATGIPNKNGNGNGGALELTYPGKLSQAQILAEPALAKFYAAQQVDSLNRLYCGDNLAALKALIEDPEIREKVTLVYIDPPFATKGTFLSRKQKMAYDDDLCGAVYVESLRQRLLLLRELLSSSGSIYLHLDETMVFQMKLVMDEVFGISNYRNMIVRKKCNPKNYTRKAYGNVADFILFYTKTDRYTWNRPVEPLTEQSTKEYHYVEPETGRRFMKVPVHAPGKRNGATGGTWRGKLPPPGKHWQYTPETLDGMDARGEIFWSKNGNPRRKVYLDEHPGVGIQDIWLEFRDAHNQNIEITGYPTEKNPDLLRRIIQASSNPGDLVLDCYAGSGTTMAVANDLQRHWIGVDRSPVAINTIFERFERGLIPMGDYVSKPPKSIKADPEPSLFDSLEEIPSTAMPQHDSTHAPITDFSIYVGDTAQSEISKAVGRWIQHHGSKRDEHRMVVSEGGNLAAACYRLHCKDKRLAGIIDTVGPCNLRPHAPEFDFLVDAIIGQQLSKQAADTISSRLRELFRERRPTPKAFMKIHKADILSIGVSQRKYDYIFDLAQRIHQRELRLETLPDLTDAEVRNSLTAVKGIGDWTVDMFLLFGLGRLDVFPVHDLALRKAMASVYGVKVGDHESLVQIANRWRPYRSVGSWYMYRTANAQQSLAADADKPRR